MKKTLIITLELGKNYGGIMQAYALQKSLNSIGIQAETTHSPHKNIKQLIKENNTVRKFLRLKSLPDWEHTTANTIKFIKNNISTVKFKSALINSNQNLYSSYITGSDQVWRESYTNVPHNLFSFVKSKDPTLISYAASFGRDDIDEYSQINHFRSRKLAQRFDALSVREDSGKNIIRNHWGLQANRHLDPTLLLNSTHYEALIDNPSTPLPDNIDGGVFVYVLDKSMKSRSIVRRVESILSMKSHTLITDVYNNGHPLPPVEQWLRSFREADFVITDSFHGTVFSIIFNKPFIAIGNKDRGLARFTSLLKIFNLTDRLVTTPEEVTYELINSKINWTEVSKSIKVEKARSLAYLTQHLGIKNE